MAEKNSNYDEKQVIEKINMLTKQSITRLIKNDSFDANELPHLLEEYAENAIAIDLKLVNLWRQRVGHISNLIDKRLNELEALSVKLTKNHAPLLAYNKAQSILPEEV